MTHHELASAKEAYAAVSEKEGQRALQAMWCCPSSLYGHDEINRDLVAAFKRQVQEQEVQANLGCSTPVVQLEVADLIWLVALNCHVNIVGDAAAQLGQEAGHETASADGQRVNGGHEQINIPALHPLYWLSMGTWEKCLFNNNRLWDEFNSLMGFDVSWAPRPINSAHQCIFPGNVQLDDLNNLSSSNASGAGSNDVLFLLRAHKC